MSSSRSVLLAVFILVFLAALGTLDAFLTPFSAPDVPETTEIAATESSSLSPTPISSEQSSSSLPSLPSFSSLPSTPPPSTPEISGPPTSSAGVTIASGPDIPSILAERQIVSQETTEVTLMGKVITGSPVMAKVLLTNGDRAGLIAWTESPGVKLFFMAIKEALQKSFSAEVTDLIDESQQQPGKPVRNILTFRDPAFGEERFAFVRVRERLYEFHIAPGKDDVIFALIEALTQ
ncbi:MAG: hypothetical protein V1926_03620 [Candidatus Peregrinibacteria bacterium]